MLRILLSLLVALGLCAAPRSPLSPHDGPVVFMSFDGIGADHFNPKTMPRLWAMVREGQRGTGIPPFPSTTFNGHVTLATGCWPGHHGVVANSFLDPMQEKIPDPASADQVEREPLWAAASRAGVKTAVYQWPGGTGPWQGIATWRMQPFRPNTPDAEAMKFVETALEDGARLVMAYLSGADREGHYHGPHSPEVRAKLARMDADLPPFIQRLRKAHPGIRFVLTSDHGMSRTRRAIDLAGLLKTELPTARMVTHGGSAYVYLRAPEDLERAETLLAAQGELRVWRKESLPQHFHLEGHRRVGDLVVEAPLDAWFPQEPGSKSMAEAKWRKGTHAYDPARPEMHAWLVVLGTGKKGVIAPTPLWNLAPTIAHWLGFKWEPAPDGEVIPELRIR